MFFEDRYSGAKAEPDVFRSLNDQGLVPWFRSFMHPAKGSYTDPGALSGLVGASEGRTQWAVHNRPFNIEGQFDPRFPIADQLDPEHRNFNPKLKLECDLMERAHQIEELRKRIVSHDDALTATITKSKVRITQVHQDIESCWADPEEATKPRRLLELEFFRGRIFGLCESRY